MVNIFYKLSGAKEKIMLSAAAIPYGIEEAKTNLTEKVSNLTAGEIDRLTANMTEKILTEIDVKYHLNDSLSVLNQMKQNNLTELLELGKKFEGIANNFTDPSGLFNMNKIIGDAMPQIKSYVSQELGNSLREYAPYIALGFGALFLTIASASYLGTSLAMRSHRKRMGYNPEFHRARKKEKNKFKRKDPLS